MAEPKVGGLVLAGGRSSRFGAEKAVQVIGGVTLLERSLAALDGVAEAVAVSARPDSGAAEVARSMGLELVTDDRDHPSGPLAGIAAGLAWAWAEGFDLLATLACDLPGVDAAILRRLVLRGGGYAVAGGRIQSLCAVWPVTALDALTEALNAGDHPPVHEMLRRSGAAAVAFEDAAPFANLNSREDLAAFERRPPARPPA